MACQSYEIGCVSGGFSDSQSHNYVDFDDATALPY